MANKIANEGSNLTREQVIEILNEEGAQVSANALEDVPGGIFFLVRHRGKILCVGVLTISAVVGTAAFALGLIPREILTLFGFN